MGHHKKQKVHNSNDISDVSSMLDNADLNNILSKYSKSDEEKSENIIEENESGNNNVNELLKNINVEELLSRFSADQSQNSKYMNNLSVNPTINFLNSLRPFVNKGNTPMLDNLIKMYAIGVLISNASNRKN